MRVKLVFSRLLTHLRSAGDGVLLQAIIVVHPELRQESGTHDDTLAGNWNLTNATRAQSQARNLGARTGEHADAR